MDMETPRARKGVLPAVGLFFLAPLVAEFLLGNLPIKMLPALVLLAPMYGGGALLIRELVRRSGRSWPSILLLGLAYGIIEEGFTTQSLFNPNYLKLNLHLLDPGFIPALGIGAWWTVFVLALHTVWSIAAPIALVEATVPDRATAPWLGRIGLAVSVLLFALGAAGNTWVGFRQDHFVSSGGQFAGAGMAIVLLAVAAFLLRRPEQGTAAGFTPSPFTPSPWMAGVIALLAGSAILLVPPRWGWWGAGAILALELGVGALVLIWARSTGWSLRHKLALAAGAALAYAWHAFIETPALGGSGASVRVGNAIFALGAIALIAFAAKRSLAWSRASGDTMG
jgi:hypothetical protein